MTHGEIVKAKEDRARKEFGQLGPMGRAKWALENCNKSRHPSAGVCLECCAEALDWTIDGGVKLAGGINDQALKLEDAGAAWKKRAEAAELQNDERDQLITLKNRQIVELTFRVQELEKILSAIPKRGTEKQVGTSPTDRPCCVEAYARGHAVGSAQRGPSCSPSCGCNCHEEG